MSETDDKLKELISSYIDDELPPAGRSEAEALCARDGAAEEMRRGMLRTRELLAGLDVVPVPVGLRHRVLKQVKGKRRPGPIASLSSWLPGFISPIPVLSTLAAVVLIVAVLFVLQPAGFGPPLTPAEKGKQESAGAARRAEPGPESDKAIQAAEAADRDRPAEGEMLAAAPDESTEAAESSAPSAVLETRRTLGESARAADERDATALEAAPGSERMTAGERERRFLGLPIVTLAELRDGAPRWGGSRGIVEAVPQETAFAMPEPVFYVARREAGEEIEPGEMPEQMDDFLLESEEPYVAERGKPRALDNAAAPGSDSNPLFDPRSFSPPSFQTFEFIGRGAPAAAEFPVFGQAHISADGKILYLRLEGPRESARLVDSLADHLFSTRLIPARMLSEIRTEAAARDRGFRAEAKRAEQKRVSVFYSFVIEISSRR